ncbi:MAG: hypothetical protein ACK2TV_13165, partial [Anaerolineales bacterium]
VQMGDWLPVREKKSPGLLMTEVDWNLELELTFESVARTPQDQPLVIVAVAQWRSGRTRVALGGYGSDAIIAMDGPDDNGAHLACKDAYYDAGDQWATAEYRRDVAAQLASRCIEKLRAIKESEV